jgi:hypothetical protein
VSAVVSTVFNTTGSERRNVNMPVFMFRCEEMTVGGTWKETKE